jgi:asparagine synthase (glutamine-hydrolysing)
MCGIAGAFWRKPPAQHERQMSAALDRLRLRGPNDRGVDVHHAAEGTVALGHARLSIIDLSAGGHQPMIAHDGALAMIFNGEIYNYIELREELRGLGYSFQSQSDSEVLLTAWAAWGRDCLARLDGMFAFAIHDRRLQRLFCARDGFGIKPLFYHAEPGAFAFASTQQALIALRGKTPRPDVQRCYDYLVHGDYDGEERSFLADVRHLRPGCLIEVDLARGIAHQPERWWQPVVRPAADMSFGSAVEAVRGHFLNSVRLQMRSDVAIGAALSGGVDSSAVVCAMRHLDRSLPIDTFSFIADDDRVSEEGWVDLINAHVGARPHKVRARVEDLLGDLDTMIEAQGEPFGSTSIYAQFRVFQAARENGVTVTLDGQGADELLAGYSGYPGYRLLSLLDRGDVLGAHRFASAWARWPGRSYRLAAMELGRIALPDGAYRAARKRLGRDFQAPWLNLPMLEREGVAFAEARPPRSSAAAGRRVIEQLCKSLQERGLPALLRHADRSSMRFSVESRVPFLTIPLAELLLGLPEPYLIGPDGETKRVFRAAMRGIVPDAVLDRRDKIGFATPEERWLRTGAPQMRAMIAAHAPEIEMLRTEPLLAAFDAVIAGRAPFSWQLWRWVNFVRWYALIVQERPVQGSSERHPLVEAA